MCLEHEKQIAAARAREEGKPEAIIPRIVEGSITKFLDEDRFAAPGLHP